MLSNSWPPAVGKSLVSDLKDTYRSTIHKAEVGGTGVMSQKTSPTFR